MIFCACSGVGAGRQAGLEYDLLSLQQCRSRTPGWPWVWSSVLAAVSGPDARLTLSMICCACSRVGAGRQADLEYDLLCLQRCRSRTPGWPRVWSFVLAAVSGPDARLARVWSSVLAAVSGLDARLTLSGIFYACSSVGAGRMAGLEYDLLCLQQGRGRTPGWPRVWSSVLVAVSEPDARLTLSRIFCACSSVGAGRQTGLEYDLLCLQQCRGRTPGWPWVGSSVCTASVADIGGAFKNARLDWERWDQNCTGER